MCLRSVLGLRTHAVLTAIYGVIVSDLFETLYLWSHLLIY